MSIFKQLHLITSHQDLAFEKKIEKLLKLGLNTFHLEVGAICQVKGRDYQINYLASRGPIELSVGDTFDFKDTYCRFTVEHGQATAVANVTHSEFAATNCFKKYGLNAYIGVPIYVDKKIYGTLNFFSKTSCKRDFTNKDLDFISVAAQWLGGELERRHTLKRLTRRSEALSSISQLASIGYWEVDLKKSQLYWSRQTRKIHQVSENYQPELASAINFYKAGTDRDTIIEKVSECQLTGCPWQLEARIITTQGQEKWLSVYAKPVMQEGQCIRIFGAVQDIHSIVMIRSELQKKRVQAEQLLAARSSFLAKVSHELRTPINGINGMLHALKDPSQSARFDEHIQMALASSDTLVALINDVLDYSKLESGNLTLESQPFDLFRLFKEASANYKTLCEPKELEFLENYTALKGIWVESDKIRLKQVLFNLLNNAVKFTQQGSVKLSGAINLDRRLEIQICDTGIGMEPSVLHNLFIPYHQADSSMARKYGGTGLGMSIVAEIVDLMGGQIKVESELNKGSCFNLTLPLTIIEHRGRDEVGVDLYATQNNFCDFAALKVLVVDDNEINRMVMQAMLTSMEVQCDLADSGQQAINLCKQRDYDIIFMDCAMPEMDGMQASAFILQHKKDKAPKIIALTAHTSAQDKQACYDAGMVGFLSKPVEPDQIKQALINSEILN
ncbi:GAF domain-containing hybrid sensor histidine kinase/response regulator [Gayadomonas joobiniege]|uniref:GAF domain-containing hybrid sensor histidine kinase/response regulator n=1 Tax=Gayadomonas joobiniege TaxID=1234606 RepID=UPI00037EF8A4|nr:response regulator [Gayadomonas joobiniege]